MTPEPLKSAYRKLDRAKLHIGNFEREMHTFLNECPRQMVIEPNPEKAQQDIHKLRFQRSVSDALFDEAGEAIHNLRSALDNACFGIARAISGVHPLNAYFPFGGSSAEFENQMRGRCKDVPEELFPLFRAFKPYKGGDDVLWAFNRVAVADKHTILRINLASQLGDVTATGGLVRLLVNPPWDDAKNEVEIGTFWHGTAIHYKIELGLTVAFHKIEVIEDEPVLAVLDYWADKVGRFLLAIESETRRLFPSAL